MDCFYAAIEMRDDPSLKDKPIAVGGQASRRGVLCTSNYIARQYGVRSAMPTSQALRLCPSLIIIHPNFKKYRSASKEIHQIFRQYTNLIEPLSLDEAYLDVTNCQFLNNRATRIAKAIRQQIFDEQGITASAGIAPNKFLAKIASDWRKPNNQFTIPPDGISTFVNKLPVEKIFGVGKVTTKKMHELSIETCADLQCFSKIELSQLFGIFGERLFALCRGIDERPVQVNRIRKSLSIEHTYEDDLTSTSTILEKLPQLINELKIRLQKHGDRTIHKLFVKVKFNDFTLTTVESRSDHVNEKILAELLQKGLQRKNLPIRLLGVGVGFEHHIEDSPQLELNYSNLSSESLDLSV